MTSIPICLNTSNRDISLLIKEQGSEPSEYPTSSIQKGLLLTHRNKNLAEEGLGFGVPVLRSGHETIFPGKGRTTIEKNGDATIVKIDYDMNLVERIAVKSSKRIENGYFYMIKEHFSSLHREYPFLRGIITKSSTRLRQALGIETRFEKSDSMGTVSVVYVVNSSDGKVYISVDTGRIEKCSEISMMNEQGANYFDIYHDSNGAILAGNSIGTWDETFADEVSFIDSHDSIMFTFEKVGGCRMFRGRELIPMRLAWAGLAYVIPPDEVDFAYSIRIGACA